MWGKFHLFSTEGDAKVEEFTSLICHVICPHCAAKDRATISNLQNDMKKWSHHRCMYLYYHLDRFKTSCLRLETKTTFERNLCSMAISYAAI